jgi:hypothetical protein
MKLLAISAAALALTHIISINAQAGTVFTPLRTSAPMIATTGYTTPRLEKIRVGISTANGNYSAGVMGLYVQLFGAPRW